ncbi:KH domain-containing protein [Hydrogenimonas cancrithermarum]|uniref:RNA-binding protein n=1 Tax=Hydrogenimonas cancrithermarum TaxID=2993563 RepID=A0ABN6WW79_9BACT|nr:KH domain-containing protein [Hydrogenimonas cancrithermarum]BDY13360.1 RNA-binding protein [Hydrogenimonas cancrithermarum]
MIETFVRDFAKLVVSHPEDVVVERRNLGENFDEIVIYTHKEDAGKLIGKEGRMINALKTVISGCKAKDGVNYRVNVRTTEEREG